MNKKILHITRDGSHTVLLPESGATYHSHHGAIRESMHVFIKAGLSAALKDRSSLNILETGMGTGLNALLTLLYTAKEHKIQYHALEPYPPEQAIIEKLNYAEQLNQKDASRMLKSIHQWEHGRERTIRSGFDLTVWKALVQKWEPVNHYDLVYYDAFAPGHQQEMWNPPVFEKLYEHMNTGGILVTFCATGFLRRSLKEIGFYVENPEGPPGKREMTRAVK